MFHSLKLHKHVKLEEIKKICVYVIYELQHVCKDVAVILCMCKLQRADDRVVIASLFDCV